jgi:hypothetical protein
MARFRVETVVDVATGKVYAELFYPENETTPLAKTPPIYSSHEQAEQEVLKFFYEAFNK